MQKPPFPPNEALRVASLKALDILDVKPEERFDRLTRLAKRLFDVPIALVSLVDSDRQWFLSAFGLEIKETPRDVSFCGHAILRDEVMTVPDTFNDERFSDNPLVIGEPGIRFYAGCPIKAVDGSKLGTLCVVDNEPREFSEEDKKLLMDLTAMVEQEIAALQIATLDELTMISNRRGFEILSQHALKVCKRLNKPASLLFIDLDDFKQINDQYGHAEGDCALREFSQLLKETFRESDVIGRLGGDEFAVLVTNSPTTNTEYALQRLFDRVQERNQNCSKGYHLAYSIGVVEYRQDKHDSLEEMLNEGDKLMYREKKQ